VRTPRTAPLTLGDKKLQISDLRRHHRSGGAPTSPSSTPNARHLHPTTPGLHLDREAASPRSLYIDGRRGGSCSIGAFPIQQPRRGTATFPRDPATLLLYGERAADRRPEGGNSTYIVNPATHHGSRADEPGFFQGFPARRPSDGGWMVGSGRRAGSGPSNHDLHRHLQNPVQPQHRVDPHDREDADARPRWAYKYSIGQPFVYPKNDLDYALETSCAMCYAGAVRGLQGQPGAGRGPMGPHLHPPRPTTSQNRLDPRRCGCPARPAPIFRFACIAAGLRLACGGPPMAAPNEAALKMLAEIGTVAPHPPNSSSAAKGQERSVPPSWAFGPPRLQRTTTPPRQDHAEDLPRRC